MADRLNLETRIPDARLRAALFAVLREIESAGGRALLMGGCVRDMLLGLEPKDLDLEVYGLGPERLRSALEKKFDVDLVGASFGVLKLRGLPIDVSIPRRESKAGLGHRGFSVFSDPNMEPREAAARRDFTINSIGLNPQSGELIDPWNGIADLKGRILRHTSSQFAEDPLRVLRGMQFAARFDFAVTSETVELCRGIHLEGLARERIFDEWRKLILRGVRPSRGLHFLKDCGWIRYYPELQALVGCPQDPQWHPEGDVWVHTLHCMDSFAGERTGQENEDLIVGWAVLCHDFGKPATTIFEDGRTRSPGHEKAGEIPTRTFLARLTNSPDLVEAVIPLVLQHMRPVELFEAASSDSAVRRLAARVGRIDRLVRVARADQGGRPPLVVKEFPAGDWLLERAHAQAIESRAPQPILMGRHLLGLGLHPGPLFKELLDAAYEAQLDGRVGTVEQGIAFVRTMLSSSENRKN